MNLPLAIFGAIFLIAGLWAFSQSPSGTQFPIPIAIGGAILVTIAFFR